MDQATDWIAVIGALAWTPYIFGTINQWLTKAKIRVITQKTAEIGFSTLGPIFNIRIACSVEHKDIVISDMKIRLRHESGEEKLFDWQGITQHVGKMTAPGAGVMPIEKENTVLAVKLNQKDIEERQIRCQEASFIATKQGYEETATKKMAYLKSEDKYDVNTFLREPEMTELYSFIRYSFPWKQGKYSLSIEFKSPENFYIVDSKREFLLSHLDIEELSKNKEIIEESYRRELAGVKEGEVDLVWQWRYPTLIKP